MRFLRWFKLSGLLVLTGCSLATAYATAQGSDVGPVPGRFVVKLSSRVSLATVSQALSSDQKLERATTLQVGRDLEGSAQWDNFYILQTTDHTLTAEQIKDRLGSGNVEYVEPDYYVEFFDFPADPLFPHQWYLHNTGQSYWAIDRLDGDFNDTLALCNGTAGNDIGLGSLYQQPPAVSTRVVVAVVDTGVDPTHPELQGQLWHNPDEIPDNGIDDDHNGFIDDIIGYDVSGDTVSVYHVTGDNDPSDDFGHGTHIAGTIAAAANQQGVVGIAPMAEIMAVKIRPNGTTVVGSMGIVYAVNAGADIINVSWGTPFESLLLKDAVEFACDNGVLVCVAVGNTGDLTYVYPAAVEKAFTVGAGDSRGYLTSFSTYGPHLDLCAPGQNILSLRATGTDMYGTHNEPLVHIVGDDSMYYLADGTSMSAPMAAGAAALIWSIRPQLTLDQLVSDLTAGARDMIDPFGIGDSLPGFDSLSGYGYLDVERSLQIARLGGMYFVQPESRSRHVGQMEITAAAVGDYIGGWELHISRPDLPDIWQLLASGGSPPSDSVLYTLSDPQFNGRVTLRLTDDYGTERFLPVVYVTETALALTSPQADQEYDYNIPISGRVYGPDYEWVAVYYRRNGASRELLFETGGEYFDSLIYSWNASGVSLGEYTIYLEGHFGSGVRNDSVSFLLTSAFAQGWPQDLSGRGGLSATAADLDNDGAKELIVGTTYGLNVFHSDGVPVEGFPVLFGSAARCIPATYDVDRDGLQEIICTTDSGLHVFNHDGTYVPGWPVSARLGVWGYGAPNPTVTELGPDDDSAIIVLDRFGSVLAYEFDGQSYFYSLEGWFTSFNTEPTTSVYFNGNCLSSSDLNGDGANEVVVSFSGVVPRSGVGVFEGRTGQPSFDRPLPYVIESSGVFGTVLADLDGDDLSEIITSGYDSLGVPTLWAKTQGTQDVVGWPRKLPQLEDWLGLYPMVADLDLDGTPEVLATFYEFDIGVLYAFRADGSPYRTVEGRPAGEVYRYAATFGVPVVADLIDDQHPEIIIRSGHLFPGAGREKIHILDHTAQPVPGWPIATPTSPDQVFSTPYAPMVDDVDGDGLVELVLVGEGLNVFVWDFEASCNEGRNRGRVLMDNLNSSEFHETGVITDVPEEPAAVLPRQFRLHQNYPNPFNPNTALSFELPSRLQVRLEVFNVLGQQVAVLVDQELPGGSHTVEFDGSPYASGVYFYRLAAGSFEATRKMVLVK